MRKVCQVLNPQDLKGRGTEKTGHIRGRRTFRDAGHLGTLDIVDVGHWGRWTLGTLDIGDVGFWGRWILGTLDIGDVGHWGRWTLGTLDNWGRRGWGTEKIGELDLGTTGAFAPLVFSGR